MKIRYAIPLFGLLLGSLAANPAGAQGFHAVSSLNGTDVTCVGDAGTIYRSFDGGATYTLQTVGATALRGAAQNGLTHLLVADGGAIWRSTNNGGTWGSQSPAGATNLRAVTMTSALIAYAIGDAGTILKSIDGGATWNPQVSGVLARLNAMKFTDDLNGWVVGAGGTVLQTIDGGANWAPVVVGTPNELLAVDVSGASVWVSGKFGTCWKSETGGASWNAVNLRLDAKSDVRSIYLASPTDAWLGGGGGFIRRSQDAGVTWTFPVHALQKPLSDIFFVGSTGWATAQGTRAVLRTTNGGTTWAFPAGSTTSRNWVSKLSSGLDVRGSSVVLNPVYPSTIYTVYGNTVYRSRDDGETWSTAATIPTTDHPNSFLVSPKDTNVWLAAVSSPKRIVKTVDGGANWVTTRTDAFGEYGLPLEMHPDKPDTVFFGADNDKLYRSTDFGSTWTAYGNTTFRSPCDIIVVPESDSAVIQVGDGITSSGQWQLWRSNDGGNLFKSLLTGSASETPGMASSRLRPTTTFATHWSSNGVHRSINGGLTWQSVHNAGSAWGVDIAKDDPNCVVFGVYSGGQSYMALDGGPASGSFSTVSLPGTNYSFLARDRGTLFAYQFGTLYKLNITHSATTTSTQSVALTAPNGGEVWEAGSVHSVTWNSTNVGLARIEYRVGPADPWLPVADVAGLDGAYAWTIPSTATTTAEVRVRDGWDNNPEDLSNAVFSIVVPGLTAGPDPIDLGLVEIGSVATSVINLENTGGATVNITDVTSGNPEFFVGRTSFSLAPGASDTLGVSYSPIDEGPDAGTITIVASDPLSPHVLNVTGEGSGVVGVGDDLPLVFAAWQNQPNPFTGTTRIRYALPHRAQVSLEVYNVQGRRIATLVNELQEPGNYSVPFGARNTTMGGHRLPSGVYFYRFTAGSFSTTHKMLMLQ